MTDLDSILEGVDTTMTPELVRLFAAAGCSPTMCHCCSKEIKAGKIFRLLSWRGTDEMCCAKHGLDDLRKRDARVTKRNDAGLRTFRQNSAGGYSRPSKAS